MTRGSDTVSSKTSQIINRIQVIAVLILMDMYEFITKIKQATVSESHIYCVSQNIEYNRTLKSL